MSEKIYGIKSNKSLAEISPMNLNGDQTVTGEKTFEKISVKDLSVVNNVSGASVTFKAQDGRAFELTLPDRAGTLALLTDVPESPKYYVHHVTLVCVYIDSSTGRNIRHHFAFEVISKSNSKMTINDLCKWFESFGNDTFHGKYEYFAFLAGSTDKCEYLASGSLFENVFVDGDLSVVKVTDQFWRGPSNVTLEVFTTSQLNIYSIKSRPDLWTITDAVYEVK